MSKKRTFYVPTEHALDFAAIIQEHELENSITGVDDEEIVVEVEYDTADREAILEIMELLDED